MGYEIERRQGEKRLHRPQVHWVYVVCAWVDNVRASQRLGLNKKKMVSGAKKKKERMREKS